MPKICPKCFKEVEVLTFDHRIPKWLLTKMGYFGFGRLKVSRLRRNNLLMLRQMICVTCNTNKGGKIDWSDPLVREFMSQFVLMIIEKLK